MAILGSRLVNLHIGTEIAAIATEFPIAADRTLVGDMPAARRWQNYNSGWRLRINNEQYIGGISEDAKSSRIAGYPVLDKWIQGRIGRSLEVVELVHI